MKRDQTSPSETYLPLDFMGPVELAFESFPDEWIEQPIAALFQRVALSRPDKIAVDDGARSLTYAQLWRAAAHLARRIESTVPAGRPVGVLLPNGALFPAAAIACLACGRPYIPIDLSYPAAHRERILAESGLAAVILDGTQDASLNVPRNVARLDIAASLHGTDAPGIAIAPPAGPAIILYTSGSTGSPKGICNDQAAIVQRVAQATNAQHLCADDRAVLLSSPGTIAGVREMFAALLNGATLYTADPLRVGIGGVLDVLRDKRVTLCYIVPALLRSLLTAPNAKPAFANFRLLRIGGDNSISSDLALCRDVLPPSCKLLLSFSSTEIPAVFQWFVPPDWQPDKQRLPIGYARPGARLTLIGEDGAPAAPGEAGELVVRSRYLALGLWQDGRLQPGPFTADPDEAGARILHTGDLVRIRADGLAEMAGRKDRQIKIRGLRVDPGQLETALRACAGVADAAVIGRGSGEEVSALVAYVVRRDKAAPVSAAELKGMLAASLPRHMQPADIHFVDAIPRLPGFKPDIKALERLDRDELARRRPSGVRNIGRESDDAIAGRSDTAKFLEARSIVKRAWVERLDQRSFDTDTAWDQAGGDSLKALEFWFAVERELGRKLPLDIFAANTTPSRLIGAIDAFLNPPRDQAAHRDDGGRPTIFLLPGIAGDEPLLVRFRAQFGDRVNFELIDYPDWREMMDRRMTVEAIADAAFAQICAKSRGKTCLLAGYSFGGFIAYETTHRLLASGRKVDCLALIDTRPGYILGRDPLQRLKDALFNPRRLGVTVLWLGLLALIRRRRFMILRALGRSAMSWPARQAYFFVTQLNTMLRLHAVREWRPTPSPVRTILFRSAEELPGDSHDFGWGALCETLQVIPIGGTHASMLEPPRLQELCDHLLTDMRAAGARSVQPAQ